MILNTLYLHQPFQFLQTMHRKKEETHIQYNTIPALIKHTLLTTRAESEGNIESQKCKLNSWIKSQNRTSKLTHCKYVYIKTML